MGIPAIMQQLLQNSPAMTSIKNMVSMIRGAQNPQTMLNQMMTSNPNAKQVMDLINQAGGDPRKAFYQLAKQKGVNPDDIMNMLK